MTRVGGPQRVFCCRKSFRRVSGHQASFHYCRFKQEGQHRQTFHSAILLILPLPKDETHKSRPPGFWAETGTLLNRDFLTGKEAGKLMPQASSFLSRAA